MKISYDERIKLAKTIIEMAEVSKISFEDKTTLQEQLQLIGIELRICSQCGRLMYKGYCFPEVGEYYCNDECLEQEMTQEEYQEYFEDDVAYYTNWI